MNTLKQVLKNVDEQELSTGLIISILVTLGAVISFGDHSSEDLLFILLPSIFGTFAVLITSYVIYYKKNTKTISFWMAAVSIMIALFFIALSVFATEMTSGHY